MSESKSWTIVLCMFISSLLFLNSNPAFGLQGDTVVEKKYIDTILTISRNMDDLKEQISDKTMELENARTREEKNKISRQIDKLGENLLVLKRNFEQIATGIDFSAHDEKARSEFKFEQEIMELLKPLIQEMKDMTARPRHIEKLRNKAAFYKSKLPDVIKAIENIQAFRRTVEDKNADYYLAEIEKSWVNEKIRLSNQLDVANLRLEELTKDKKSFLESGRDFLRVFFKSRGRNLFLSMLAFISVFFLLRMVHRAIYRFSPIHRVKERPFYIRLCDVIYHILTVAGAASALLLVLYFSGDWVLLTLFAVFLLGFVWAAKQNIPKFWGQIKMLLNLGSVRENERLIYNGVPWRVASLNLFTRLENPALKNRLRVPLQKLLDLESYPCQEDAPWFPCRENDWVIIDGGFLGRVISQTHEMVRLALRGGGYRTFLTEEFLGLNPTNISADFRLRVSFGIDYRHQAASTNEIPRKLQEKLSGSLKEEVYGKHLLGLDVEFESVAVSSLNLMVRADFSGKAAEYYNEIGRAVQRITVEACTENGWEIPFTQLVLHNAAENISDGS